MAVVLSSRFLDELKKSVNIPNVVLELELDSGTVLFGYHGRNSLPVVILRADGGHRADGSIAAVGSDALPPVIPALKSVSSLQNKLDPKSGYSTRGQLTAVITGRDNFKAIITDEYLKNRRVVRKDGFIAPGLTYLDYAVTFTGKIIDWSRRGDDLALIIADDLKDASAKIPVETPSKTRFIEYIDMNPVDIMTDILANRLGISPSLIDIEAFTLERDTWLSGWRFNRVLTDPVEANQYLNELQIESNSFIMHDGEKIGFKVFSPPAPWQEVEEWDERTLLNGSFSQKAGYRENFYNRVIVYFDYDESGGDKEENFESAVVSADLASQDAAQWNESSTKVIKSRWIRSLKWSVSGMPGVTIYHASRANGHGTGMLSYQAGTGTVKWAAPGGSQGEPVKISQDGRYQVFDSDKRRYVRIIAVAAGLPNADTATPVALSDLSGESAAAALSQKLLSRYRDPASSVGFDIDINSMASGGKFIKPTDLKDITTSEACGKGQASWARNRLMLTSVRPDFSECKVSIEAIETRMHRRYGFIAGAGLPDYGTAAKREKSYGFIGDPDNNTSGEDGYYTW